MSGVIAPSAHSPDHGIAMPDGASRALSRVCPYGGTAANKPNDDNNNNDNNDPTVFDLCRHMKYFLLCLRLAGLLRTCSTEDSATTASRWRRCGLLLQMPQRCGLSAGLAEPRPGPVRVHHRHVVWRLSLQPAGHVRLVPAGGAGSEQSLASVASADDVSAAVQVSSRSACDWWPLFVPGLNKKLFKTK